MFHPTLVDIMIFVGSFGVFLTLFLIFLRVLPVFAMAELKAVLPQASPHDHGHGDGHGHEHGHDKTHGGDQAKAHTHGHSKGGKH